VQHKSRQPKWGTSTGTRARSCVVRAKAMTRTVVLPTGIAALLGAAVLALPSPAWANPFPGPQTFSYTGTEQIYTVPDGVTMVQVEAVGGNGSPDANHGVGLDLSVALPVVPQQPLYAEVGAAGGVSSFGGGAPGAAGAGSGGGASDVRTCSEAAATCPGGGTSSASRLVVASGGGGGGAAPVLLWGSACGVSGGAGNAWDGLSAAVSVPGGTVLLGQSGIDHAPASPAQGGQATGPGAGGVTPDCTGVAADFAGSVSGSGGSGSNGGAGATPIGAPPGGSGGGGGGGYFGGGGGASGQTETRPAPSGGSDGGGGGGGSSFYTSQATGDIFYGRNGTTTQPTVTITPLIEINTPSPNANFSPGQVVDASYSCLDSCSGTVPSGSPIDTSTVGVHSFQVTDRYLSHPVAVSTVHYTVGTCGSTMTQCITSSSSDWVSVGSPFSFNVTTSGSPSPTIKTKGKLPKGVKFHKGIGTATLSGTPTSTKHRSAAGTYHLTITATFGKGKTKDVVTQAFTLSVTA
jgi:hypothetical protein